MSKIILFLIIIVFIALSAKDGEELKSYFYTLSFIIFVSVAIYIYFKRLDKKKLNSFPYSFYSKVVGVSFDNDDGTSRQDNIKKYLSVGDELYMKVYNYKGEPAIALLAKDGKMNTQVGNLSADLAADIVSLPDDTRILIVVKDITGGTKDKKTVGVNIEIFSTNEI